MGISRRIARLLQADMHGLLDQLEDPESMLKQALREMQTALAQNEARLQGLQKQHGPLQTQCHEWARKLNDLEGQIELCFASDNDNLAKALLRKQLEAQQALQLAQQRQQALQAEQTALQDELAGQRDKLQSVLDKMQLLAISAGEEPNADPPCAGGVSQEDVELAFMQAKQRHRQQPPSQERQP